MQTRIAPTITSTIAALALTFLAAQPALAIEPGTLAEDWTRQTIDGETRTLSEQVKSRPQVMFFWASWCPFCKAMMPHLQSIKLEYGDEIDILSVNFREDGDPLVVLREGDYDFIMIPDADDVAELYDVYGTPGVLLVDGNRRIQFDLRNVQRPAANEDNQPANRGVASRRLASYWAAELRKAIREL